ncbi:MAG: hypothetical protein KJT03_18720, partial [Verrucomicrobiae bacterium]|nr:hypothetical protein [Verrucomicrobiae bacterium]
DSVAFFEDSFAHVTRQMNPDTLWNSSIRNLFSQAFSAEWGSGFERENFLEDWNASNQIYGRLAENLDDLEACRDWFRAFGFPDVVCKAPFGTAAGGNRCVLEKEGMTRPMKDWLTKIWEEQGAVVVEPWLDRVYDFSVQFEMGESGLKLVAFTRLINNARGQFRGILTNAFCKDAEEEISRFLLQPGQKRPRVYEWYDNVLRPRLEVVLKEVGFRGPLGLDAFVFREPGGALRLKTLVEINPRITMGRVAHELSRHAADGAAGLFQIVSRKQVKKSGFASLSEYAAELEKAHPAQFANKTGSRIQSGSLAVTDPETARNFLAVFHVRRAVGEILPLLF